MQLAHDVTGLSPILLFSGLLYLRYTTLLTQMSVEHPGFVTSNDNKLVTMQHMLLFLGKM